VFSASIVISIGGTADHRPEDLLRDADTAMYRAKAEGIAKHGGFDITMHDQAVALLQLENDLRRALERGELRVHYQPIVALQSARIVGFEALVRWQHRQRGLVAPGEFIPMAEEIGVIGAVGKFVLAEACRRCARPATPARAPASLSVNVSVPDPPAGLVGESAGCCRPRAGRAHGWARRACWWRAGPPPPAACTG
jgi:predicted signal transduction protein with EAL and GGDEF domain